MDYSDLLEQHAATHGQDLYAVLGGRRYTYARAWADAEAFVLPSWAALFPRTYKAAVLVVTPDLYHQLLAFVALMRAGQVPVLGHYDLPAAAEAQLVEKNKIAFVLTERDGQWDLRRGWQEAGETAPPAPYQDVCMGVLSSGSTDVPKVMYRTYDSWAGFFPVQNERFCIDREAVVLTEGSFAFTGNLSVWASVLYAGACLVGSSVLNCRQWLRLLADYGVTVLYLVPTKLKLLTQYLDRAYPSLRMILAGSQLLGARTAERLRAGFPQAEIVLYYGASEVDYITWLTYDEVLQYPDSVGKPVPGVRVWCEGGLVYLDTPYHVAGLAQPCTLHDAGHFNDAGYLIFEGRVTNIINKGGFKINCTKVQNALEALEGIVEAVVLPYEDSGRGQEAAAFVVIEAAARDRVTRASIRKALGGSLMRQEWPKKICFVPSLPLNSRGKIDQGALLCLLAEGTGSSGTAGA